MTFSINIGDGGNLLVIGKWPTPAKALATMTIIVLCIGLAVASGQIIIHDVLPTFWNSPVESEAELAKEVKAIEISLLQIPRKNNICLFIKQMPFCLPSNSPTSMYLE